jgi:hypothetical protein
MAIALVTGSKATATTAGITTPIAPTNGNVLVLILGNRTVDDTVSSVSSPHATWTKAKSSTAIGNPAVEIWIGAVSAPSGAEVITVTWATAGNPLAIVAEFSGLSTTNDGTGTANQANGSPSSVGNYTTINANDLVIAAVMVQSNVTPTDPATGTTPTWSSEGVVTAGTGNTSRAMEASFSILSATGTWSASWTNGSSLWAAALVGIQATAPTTPIGKLVSVLQAVNRASTY